MKSFGRLLLAAILALTLASVTAAETESLDGYLAAVTALEGQLERGDLAAVQQGAAALLTTTVAVDGATLVPDRGLFEPLAQAPDLAAARRLAPRLAALRRALAALPGHSETAVDDELLRRLAAAEARDTPRGDNFDIAAEGGFLQALDDLVRPIVNFLDKVVREFWEWLTDLFRPDKAEGGWLSGLPLPSLVTVLVGVFALALALLAVRAWRARRRPVASLAPAAAAPLAEDDDPMSRDAGGWRRYARELAAAGRHREAIRAWYHAVLVALYGRGFVSYRKGRTNWEVVAALSPGLGLRPAFIELTRLFDREWYGLRQSPPEALGEAEDLARGLLGELETGGREA